MNLLKGCATQLLMLSFPSTEATKTQIDVALASAEKRFSENPERADIITKTRRFKSSWIELAEALSSCQKQTLYQKWGYSSFEDYYRKELHLRPATVDKLIGSYAFLHKKAPSVLSRDGIETQIPSYQSIDFLRRAEQALEEGQAAEDIVSEVRQAVLEESHSLPKISRLFKKTLFPEEIEQEKKKQRAETEKIARRLTELIKTIQAILPTQVFKQTEEALSRLLEILKVDSEAALNDQI